MTTGITHTGLIAAIGECSSWQDIQAKWRTRPEKQKDDLFEGLGQSLPSARSRIRQQAHVRLAGPYSKCNICGCRTL